MRHAYVLLNERIRSLLDSEQGPDGDEVDDVLTTGYAHALELETERARVERRLQECLGGIDDLEVAREVRALSRRLTAIDTELRSLRTALADVRMRFPSPNAVQ